MKELVTYKMAELLNEGVRCAKKTRPPSDGGMFSLFTVELKNGWYYQVDFVNDSRFYPQPKVFVYAFRPPRNFSARAADYYLSQEIVEG